MVPVHPYPARHFTSEFKSRKLMPRFRSNFLWRVLYKQSFLWSAFLYFSCVVCSAAICSCSYTPSLPLSAGATNPSLLIFNSVNSTATCILKLLVHFYMRKKAQRRPPLLRWGNCSWGCNRKKQKTKKKLLSC